MSHHFLLYHIILTARGRRGLISPAWEKELTIYLGARAQALRCTPHAINGTATHLHLVLGIPATQPVSEVIGKLKSGSAFRIKQSHPEVDFAWEPDYYVATISEAARERLVGYVKAQKQHHGGGTVIAAFELPAGGED